jgi:NADPH2:quinone reductase
MRAIAYDETGASSVLTLRDVPVVAPAPGEVRVRIAVSGVNPTDWKARAAAPQRFEKAKTPNQDGAGLVDAVGDDVTGLSVGDRVWVWDAAFERDQGTAQEFAIVPAAQVVPLPDDASFDLGASLGIPALTAHRALTANENGPSRLAPGALDGQVVLVTGGAGAVSHAAIQLARWAGATVITTVSGDEKAELARRAGAHHVVNYRTSDVAAAVRAVSERGVDTVVDVNVLANLATDLDVVAFGGTVAVYASDFDSDEPLPVPLGPSMRKNVRFQFVLTYTVTDAQKRDAVAAVSAAVADGALPVGEEHGLPITRFALEETGAAHDAVENGAVGKVMVDVASV